LNVIERKEEKIGSEVKKKVDRRAARGQDVGRCAANANGRDMKFKNPTEKARRANSRLGTPSAAKSLGRFSSQLVGDFAHRSIPCSAPDVLTR
jgi:hypothetical protein